MTKITPSASQVAQKYQIETQKLSPEQLQKLDTDKSGQIEAGEMEAARKLTDTNNDGMIDQRENKILQTLLGKEDRPQDIAPFLEANLSQRAATLAKDSEGAEQKAMSHLQHSETKLHTARSEMTKALNQAPLSLEGTPEPSSDLKTLQSERAKKPSAEAIQVEEKKLSQNEERLQTLEQGYKEAGATVEKIRHSLGRSRASVDDLLKTKEKHVKHFQEEIEKLPRLSQDYPTSAAKTEGLKKLRTQIEQIDKDISKLNKSNPKNEAERTAKKEKLEHLKTAEKEATAARDELKSFDPASAERDIRHATKRLKELEGDIAELKGAKNTLDAYPIAKAELQKEIQTSKEIIEPTKALDRQIAYAQALEGPKQNLLAAETAVKDAKGNVGQVKQERQTLQTLLLESQSKEFNAIRHQEAEGMKALEKAEAAQTNFESPAVQGQIKTLMTAKRVDSLVDQGHLKAKDVNWDVLDRDLKVSQKAVDRASSGMEEAANGVIQKLEDPAFQAALQKMPEDKRDDIMGRMLLSISKTQAGQAYFDKNVAPALEGDPKAPPLWRNAYDGLKNGQKSTLNLLEASGAMLASREVGKASKLLDSGMSRALGIKPDQLGVVEEAASLYNKGNETAAKELLKKSDLGHLGSNLTKIAGTFTVLTGLVAVADLVQNPNLKNIASTGKSALEVTSLAGKLVEESTRFGRFAKIAGKAAPPVDMVLGAVGLFGEKGAIHRGDIGGTIGNSLTMAGGTVAAAGLALSATGVGSVGGVPIAAIGAIISGVGGLVDWIWGDSSTTKWLKENAPEYVR